MPNMLSETLYLMKRQEATAFLGISGTHLWRMRPNIHVLRLAGNDYRFPSPSLRYLKNELDDSHPERLLTVAQELATTAVAEEIAVAEESLLDISITETSENGLLPLKRVMTIFNVGRMTLFDWRESGQISIHKAAAYPHATFIPEEEIRSVYQWEGPFQSSEEIASV
jgi:hypothetical protein